MSISIDVDSIVTPKERHTFGPPNYQDYQYAEVQKLCEAFAWSSAPWAEPSPIRGTTETSCNSIRYYRLLGVARAHARRTALQLYNEEQPPTLTSDEARIFPHLLTRAIWINYYVPVDFEQPRLFEGVWGAASAGSSFRLHRELTYVSALIRNIRQGSGTSLLGSEATAPDFMDDASDLCQLLLEATDESIRLNIPLLLHG